MSKIKEVINRLITDIREFIQAGIVFLIYCLITRLTRSAFCPLLMATGIPCAGCGLTRAALLLAQGEVIGAARINPSIFAVLIFLLYCGYFRYIKGSAIIGLKAALGALVLCMLIIYGYRMYLYFPDKVPYVYASSNLAAGWIPGYDELMQKLQNAVRAFRTGI